MADFMGEIVIEEHFTSFDGDEYEEVNWLDLADIEITATDNIYSTIYGLLNWEYHHMIPNNWYSIVWFSIGAWTYNDYTNNRTKSWTNVTINKWDTTTFSDWLSDNPYSYNEDCTILVDDITFIRKDNQNNTITTSFKNNIEYKLWGSGGWNSYAPNSPDKPKYHWVWPEEDYQALENKYTEQENDTMFFTY